MSTLTYMTTAAQNPFVDPEQQGRQAYATAGTSRVAPSHLWVDGPVGSDPQEAVKAWYRGWDQAAEEALQ